MSSTLVRNIGQLVTNDPEFGLRADAALIFSEGKIQWIGDHSKAPDADSVIDADGACVIPGFVDSHTHAIFAGDRLGDFVTRMNGTPYQSGGIQRTVIATRGASEDALRNHLENMTKEFTSHGITTFEIKSGYGLEIETEERLLRIAREFTHETTFLGAHVIPQNIQRIAGITLILVKGPMLEACAPHSAWIDVFCEVGAFSVDEAREIIEAGIAKGLRGRLHGNQLGDSGGLN
jgi:imidazolonepropionase